MLNDCKVNKECEATIENKSFCELYGCTPCYACLECIYRYQCRKSDHQFCDHLKEKLIHYIPQSFFDERGGIEIWRKNRIFVYQCPMCSGQRRYDEFLEYYDPLK